MTQVVGVAIPPIDKDEATKEYHRKRLLELSLKSLGQIPQLDEPTDEQKQWISYKMKASKRAWEVWDQK